MFSNVLNFSNRLIKNSIKPLSQLLYLGAIFQIPNFVNSKQLRQRDFTLASTVSDMEINELAYSFTQNPEGGWFFTWIDSNLSPRTINGRLVNDDGNLENLYTITDTSTGTIAALPLLRTISFEPDEYLTVWIRANQGPLARHFSLNNDNTINLISDSAPTITSGISFMTFINKKQFAEIYSVSNIVVIDIYDTNSIEIFHHVETISNSFNLLESLPLAYLGNTSYCPNDACFVACWRQDDNINICRIFDNNGNFISTPISINQNFGTSSDIINYFSVTSSAGVNENWYLAVLAQGEGIPKQVNGYVYSDTSQILGPISLTPDVENSIFGTLEAERPQIISLNNGYLAFFVQIIDLRLPRKFTLQLQILNQNLTAQTSFLKVTDFPDIAETWIQPDSATNSICVSWSRIRSGSFTASNRIMGTILKFDLQADNLNQHHVFNEDDNLYIDAINLTPSILNNNPTVSIQLSNQNAGQILTKTLAGISSTYSHSTGLWQITAGIDLVNVFNKRIEFSPSANFNGNLTLDISITDGFSVVRQGVIDLTILPVNDPPEQTQTLPLLIAQVNVPFSQIVNFNNYFVDVDNALLNFIVDTGNSWFSYDAMTSTFSGIPIINNLGQHTALITVDDLSGGQINQTLIIDVQSSLIIANGNYNDTFIEDNTITLRTLNVSTPQGFVDFSLSVNDPAIQIQSQPSTITPTYDPNNGLWQVMGLIGPVNDLLSTLSLNVPDDYEQTIHFQISASDTLNPTFNGQIDLTIQPVNDAPRLINAPTNQIITINQQTFIALPTNAFFDPDIGDTLRLTALLGDNSPLPNWLRFLADEGVFIATATEANIGSYSITIDAFDNQNASTRTSFVLNVQASNMTSGTEGTLGLPDDTSDDNSGSNDNATAIAIASTAASVGVLAISCVGALAAGFCFFSHKQKNNGQQNPKTKQPIELINLEH